MLAISSCHCAFVVHHLLLVVHSYCSSFFLCYVLLVFVNVSSHSCCLSALPHCVLSMFVNVFSCSCCLSNASLLCFVIIAYWCFFTMFYSYSLTPLCCVLLVFIGSSLLCSIGVHHRLFDVFCWCLSTPPFCAQLLFITTSLICSIDVPWCLLVVLC